jgi:hypothetical protein
MSALFSSLVKGHKRSGVRALRLSRRGFFALVGTAALSACKRSSPTKKPSPKVALYIVNRDAFMKSAAIESSRAYLAVNDLVVGLYARGIQ